MSASRLPLTLGAVLVFLCAACLGAEPERKALSAQEQTAFLSRRTGSGMLGTFDSFCSLLYATQDVAIHTDSRAVNGTGLDSPFPEFYKPTWSELFDSIARQTLSSWTYDPKLDYWVFSKPPQPLPYEIVIADKWQSEDTGSYVGYRPAIAPVGMDIYMMGTYSVSEEGGKAEDLYAKVREDIALRFAAVFKKDVTTKEMSLVKVGDLNALHFKIASPQNGVIWRQWAIVESGRAFVIVSAIKPEQDAQIFPDVEKMIKTFKMKKDIDKPPKPKEKA